MALYGAICEGHRISLDYDYDIRYLLEDMVNVFYLLYDDTSTTVEAVRKTIDLQDESRKKVREGIKNMIVL